MGAEVGGGREGGDKEVQTNKHSNPKSASARSARPEVVRADARGGTGRGGRAAERDSGGRGRRAGPRPRTDSGALSRSGPKFLRPEAAEWILLRIYLYIFPRARALPPRTALHAFLRTTLTTPSHTRARTPPPTRLRGGKAVALEFRGLRGGDRG